LRWALGDFREPDGMRHPLWDEDCAQCHPTYSPARDDAFHASADHALDFPYGCVECHAAHPTDVDPALDHLARERVLPVCRNCHEEF
jgi:predicted CXXCH cytochrome family protein